MKIFARITAAAMLLYCVSVAVPNAACADDSVITKKLLLSFSSSPGEECTLRVMKENTVKTLADCVYVDEQVISKDGTAEFDIKLEPKYGECRYIAVSTSGEKISGGVSASAKINDNEAYYLADDDFTMLKANSSDTLSDWGYDVTQANGTISYDSEGLTLTDTAADGSVAIKRTFEKQTDVKMCVEFRLKLIDMLADGTGFSLRCGNADVLTVKTDKNRIRIGDYSSDLLKYQNEYGVRVELNLLMQTADAYLNGSKFADNVPISTFSADNMEFYTSKQGSGSVSLACVRIMRGYFAADEFIAYTKDQTLPENGAWETSSNGGSVKIVKSVGTPSADYYSLSLKDTSESAAVGIEKALDASAENMTLGFKFYSESAVKMLNVDLGGFSARVNSGILEIKNKDGIYISTGKLADGLWNTVKLTLNFTDGLASVQINGKEKDESIAFASSEDSAKKLGFSTGLPETEEIWLDDIYLSEIVEHDDYPTEPAKTEKGANDVLVGIQTCDLWREGKHFGWDKINGYPSRRPYLGYYDDGSAEVADWEIKYMAEHGIDWVIRCWYRPGYIGTPIKEPRNGYALHDGYFNAKYKDKIKFAIAWENAGWTTSDATAAMSDFKDNIVPFWIEYYFKDPNYMILDNKVVLNIYNVDKLTESLGADGVGAAISYLTAEVRKIGFDGIYLIGQTSSADSSVLQNYRDNGYDAVYCYSYGQKNVSLYKQMECISAQKSKDSIISSIPTLTMGRDDSAWNRAEGAFLTPRAFGELCTWVKNTYFPNGASGTALGNRMIMLDNWNEYGEGHFFMPSEIAGFEYLEALGNVFGQPEHTDVRPKNTQRLGHLYDSQRQLANKEGKLKWYDSAESEPIFNYSTTADFKKCSSAGSSYYSTFDSSSNILTATPSRRYSTDPYFYTADNLNVALTDRDIIHLKYKKPASADKITVYFTTSADTAFNSAKSFSAAVSDTDDWIDVYFSAETNESWSGTLKRLQIRPFGGGSGTDTFQFSVIEILRCQASEYIPRQFSVSFCGFMSDSDNIEEIPAVSTDATARYEFYSPYSGDTYCAFAAEYDGDELTDVKFVDNYTVKNGSSYLDIPITLKHGHWYVTGIWSKSTFVPLTTGNVLK